MKRQSVILALALLGLGVAGFIIWQKRQHKETYAFVDIPPSDQSSAAGCNDYCH